MKIIIATITGLFVLIGGVWGSVQIADTRYEMQIVHKPEHVLITQSLDSYAYTALKTEIREIRNEIWKLNGSDANRRRQLDLDLQDAIDRLCRQFPMDRECQ